MEKVSSSKRVFVAIPLPDDVKAHLSEMQKHLKHASLRWTPILNLHVTVHFIGAVEQEMLNGISEKMKQVAEKLSSFELISNELQLVMKNRKPLMVWVNFRDSRDFEILTNELRTMLPGDIAKPAVPHITLARFGKWKKIPQFDKLPSLGNFNINVKGIELWESVLGSGFPKYHCLQQFPFKSETATGK